MTVTSFAPRAAAATAVCGCRFASAAPDHHAVLVAAPTVMPAALELVELAVTWNELDYSAEEVIPPTDWLDFAAEHDWDDPATAERLFSAAVDIALRRGGCSGTRLNR